MLIIDGKKMKIIEQFFYVGTFTNNGVKGYNIHIQLLFLNNNNMQKGFINLEVGFDTHNDIRVFINREYSGRHFDSSNDIFFEVFDTNKFLDTEIDGKLLVRFGNLNNNKVYAFMEVNDDLISIKYDGYLSRDTFRTKENLAI